MRRALLTMISTSRIIIHISEVNGSLPNLLPFRCHFPWPIFNPMLLEINWQIRVELAKGAVVVSQSKVLCERKIIDNGIEIVREVVRKQKVVVIEGRP